MQQIEIERGRIARLQAQDPAVSGGEIEKDRRLTSMRKYLEELKIFADINDPAIKKRFEDGEGMRMSLLYLSSVLMVLFAVLRRYGSPHISLSCG